jgi:ferric-dicitrate binding protein FerR (iron transport regulator)
MSEHGRELVRLDMLDDVLLLRAALVRWMHQATEAEREVERLSECVRDLEAQLAHRRSEEIEELQRGRLLAAAEARRIERRSQPPLSRRTLLLVAYAALLAAIAALVALGAVYG